MSTTGGSGGTTTTVATLAQFTAAATSDKMVTVVKGVITSVTKVKLLIESFVFVDTKKVITFLDSKSPGYAVVNDVDLGGSTKDAPKGTFTKPDYSYTLLGSSKVEAAVIGTAGQTLTF